MHQLVAKVNHMQRHQIHWIANDFAEYTRLSNGTVLLLPNTFDFPKYSPYRFEPMKRFQLSFPMK